MNSKLLNSKIAWLVWDDEGFNVLRSFVLATSRVGLITIMDWLNMMTSITVIQDEKKAAMSRLGFM